MAIPFFKGVVTFVKELGKALWTPENAREVFERAAEYVQRDSEVPQPQLPEVVPPREDLPIPAVIPPLRELPVILLDMIYSVNVFAAGLYFSLLALLTTRSARVHEDVGQQDEEEEHGHEEEEEEDHREDVNEHHHEEEERHHEEEERHHAGPVRQYLITGAQVLIFVWFYGIPGWVSTLFTTRH